MKYEPSNKNISQTTRPLMTKNEMRLMSGDEQVIIVEKNRPVRAKKIVYYKDKALQSRILPPPDIPTLQIEEHKIPKFNLGTKKQPDKKAALKSIPTDLPPQETSRIAPELNDLLDNPTTAFPEKEIVHRAFAASILQALGED